MKSETTVRWDELGLVMLAAGASVRFASNKLAANFLGSPLIRKTAAIYAALPFATRLCVTSQDTPSVADLGFTEIRIERGKPQSYSLAAGVAHMPRDISGIMIALADMPLVSASHLQALKQAFDGSRTVCSEANGIPCPPALFPAAMREELCSQHGDRGARRFLQNAVAVPANPIELLDIDTPEAMARAEHACQNRA